MEDTQTVQVTIVCGRVRHIHVPVGTTIERALEVAKIPRAARGLDVNGRVLHPEDRLYYHATWVFSYQDVFETSEEMADELRVQTRQLDEPVKLFATWLDRVTAEDFRQWMMESDPED